MKNEIPYKKFNNLTRIDMLSIYSFLLLSLK